MTTVNCRVIQKHGTETDWANSELVPYNGELIVYDPDDSYSYSRFKVGDGVHNVTELPFSVVQSDWKQTDKTALDFIKNKPETLVDTTLTVSGKAADAKAVGDALAQKSQVQIITWEADD